MKDFVRVSNAILIGFSGARLCYQSPSPVWLITASALRISKHHCDGISDPLPRRDMNLDMNLGSVNSLSDPNEARLMVRFF